MTQAPNLMSPGDVQSMVAQVMSGKLPQSPEKTQEHLKIFRAYECWQPYAKLLYELVKRSEYRSTDLVARLAYTHIHGTRDFPLAIKVLKDYLAKTKPTFDRFLNEVLGHLSVTQQQLAEIAWQLSGSLVKTEEVKCLENISILYEKRLPDGQMLTNTYKKIMTLDNENLRALRFFKNFHTQNQDWERVVEVLTQLQELTPYQEERFRVSHEIAGIYLYQMDRVDDAIDVVERFCSESPLDTSGLLYDAYSSREDWSSCVKILRECLLAAEGDFKRSILHYRLGQLHQKLGHLKDAKSHFETACGLQPFFWEAIEELVHIAISRKDWNSLSELLEDCREKVTFEDQREALNKLLSQLQNGRPHASTDSTKTS